MSNVDSLLKSQPEIIWGKPCKYNTPILTAVVLYYDTIPTEKPSPDCQNAHISIKSFKNFLGQYH